MVLSGIVCGGFDDFCDHEMITLMTSDGHAVCGSPGNGGDAKKSEPLHTRLPCFFVGKECFDLWL